MFLISCTREIVEKVKDEKTEYIDMGYRDSMTRNIFDNFTEKWGKDGCKLAMKHLAEGKLIGSENGFDAIFGANVQGARVRRKIYCFHSYTKSYDYNSQSSFWVRLFFSYDAMKKYSSENDKSQKWGEHIQDVSNTDVC